MTVKKRKILMVLMGLDIGGAETHVVELSKELKRQGYDVCVVSRGGVYQAELENAGIRCFYAPLHKRSPMLMLRSLLLLHRIIRREKPDVVHAHARIPGFLCGILHRFMGFPFVTSAHWVFQTGGFLTSLSNWGQETVAVSEDIKTYLMDSYGVKPEHIIVTINGIDTEKFSPAVSGERVQAEFHLDPARPIISYVSRLDDSRALVAAQLIDLAPELAAACPGLQILIAGGGNVFDQLKARAEDVNRTLGYPCLTLTGPRTDINEIVAAGDLFIGVSRAALEAMAAAKPVIVAGNEGYIGLFDQSRLELAQGSNFCCRGCPQSSPELLKADILRALSLNEQERKALGDYGREVIFQYYSVRRMAEDCLTAYRRVWAPLRVVVSGYYGYNNLGDESILLSLRRQFAALDPQVCLSVLSRDPQLTREQYGVHAIPRFRFPAVMREIRRCDLLLSGGGSLLQDATSTRSLLYYLFVISWAKRCRKPVLLYANGIGPVNKPANRARVKKVVDRADLITLREENSLDELRAMGVTRPPMEVTADPVFTIDAVPKEEAKALLTAQGIPTDKPLVGLSVRNAAGMAEHVGEFARFCDRLCREKGYTVVFLLMQLPNDEKISADIMAAMKETAYAFRSPYAPEHMMGVISLMDAVVSLRLHTLIFAAKQRVPFLGVSYDPKVDALLSQCGMPCAGSPADFTADRAMEALCALLDSGAEQKAAYAAAVAEMERRAALNDQAIRRVLGEN